MTQNLEATVEPDESQTTISEHPAGENDGDVSACPKWLMEEKTEVVGTSI